MLNIYFHPKDNHDRVHTLNNLTDIFLLQIHMYIYPKDNHSRVHSEDNDILNILNNDNINFLYELIRRIFNKKYYTNSIVIFDKKKYIINIFEKSLLINNLNDQSDCTKIYIPNLKNIL